MFCVLWYFPHFRRFYSSIFFFCLGSFFVFRCVGYDMNNWKMVCVLFEYFETTRLLGGWYVRLYSRNCWNFAAMYYIKWIKVTLLPWLCARMLEQILKLVWKWTAFPRLIYFIFLYKKRIEKNRIYRNGG